MGGATVYQCTINPLAFLSGYLFLSSSLPVKNCVANRSLHSTVLAMLVAFSCSTGLLAVKPGRGLFLGGAAGPTLGKLDLHVMCGEKRSAACSVRSGSCMMMQLQDWWQFRAARQAQG